MPRLTPVSAVGAALAILSLSACGGGGGDAPAANVAPSAACLVAHAQAPPPAPSPGAPPPEIALGLEPITAALNFPLLLTAPPGDNDRLFVVEKGGRIRIINRNTKAIQGTFLDVTALVSTGGEQGLLGLAFDPQYAVNRRLYVNYTDVNGTSVIARYLANPGNLDQALTPEDRVILTLAQPFANHNGGMIAFGPDGFLYIGFGDGGNGGDPQNHAQNLNDLLGKLLRIDVLQATQPPMPAYTVPVGNPCVGQPGIRGELWSLGLRNPWRLSFDRQTGDLYVADVGQSAREEINVSLSSDGGGKGLSYGWNVMEGTLCFPIGVSCSEAGLTLPFVEYDHTQGCSITGGYVYRGQAITNLAGTYFYADFCAGFVRSFRFVNGQVTEHVEWGSLNPGGNITSFGEDAAGELYVMTAQGGLFRIVSN